MSANSSPLVLVVGAGGNLGRALVTTLREAGHPVRAAVRSDAAAAAVTAPGVETVRADLRDRASLDLACKGAAAVITAAHALPGRGDNGPRQVDDLGHRHLLAAARDARIDHFLYVSACYVGPDHPIDFFRIKHATEQRVKAAGLPWTIVRGAAFMETQNDFVGQRILDTGKAMVAGRGDLPMNLVSVRDVAYYCELALREPRLRERLIEVGGPQELTQHQVLDTYERITGAAVKRTTMPVGVLRLLSGIARPVHPGMSRLLRLFAYSATHGGSVDMGPLLGEFPRELTSFEQVVTEWWAGQEKTAARGAVA